MNETELQITKNQEYLNHFMVFSNNMKNGALDCDTQRNDSYVCKCWHAVTDERRVKTLVVFVKKYISSGVELMDVAPQILSQYYHYW